MVESSPDQRVMLGGWETGRGYNLTCGPTCTYPILGVGALLLYSFFMREAPSRSRVDEDLTKEPLDAEQSKGGNLFEFEGSLREKIKDEYRKAVTRERRLEREEQRRRLQELKTGENDLGWHWHTCHTILLSLGRHTISYFHVLPSRVISCQSLGEKEKR